VRPSRVRFDFGALLRRFSGCTSSVRRSDLGSDSKWFDSTHPDQCPTSTATLGFATPRLWAENGRRARLADVAQLVERLLAMQEVGSPSLLIRSGVTPTAYVLHMPYANPDDKRSWQRAWKRKRREDWLAEHGPCKRCGSTKKLNVHHTNAEDKISHRFWTWCAARREAELSKCIVLCSKCHFAADQEAGNRRPRTHGTDAMYMSGCRCPECFSWKQRANARGKIMGWR
jgi:hypothetical protein